MGFAPLMRLGYVVSSRPRQGRLRADATDTTIRPLILRSELAAREMTLPLGRLESAAKRLDLETERQRQRRNVLAANVRNVFASTWWGR